MGRRLEITGWSIFGTALVAALVLLQFDGPEWLIATTLWTCFAVAVPLVFVDLRSRWQEMSSYAAVLGPSRFWLLIAGTLVFIALFAGANIWLSDKIGWPEAYGFSCHGRGCWIDDLSHSPMLLRGGSSYELGLFALIWTLPSFLVGCLIYAAIKRLGSKRDKIQPMD